MGVQGVQVYAYFLFLPPPLRFSVPSLVPLKRATVLLSYLSCQRELQRYTEIIRRGGVRRGRYHGDIRLVVEVGIEREHAREGVVG